MRFSTSVLTLILLCNSQPGMAEITVPHTTLAKDNPEMTLQRFAFGSCWKPHHSQAHWQPLVANKPQLWMWLGDNIYADTEDMNVLARKYRELGNHPGYIALKKTCPVIATWDDHDYGTNDIGSSYSKRDESEQAFLNFFNEPRDSPRRKRPGIYTSFYFGKADQRVQLILLDTRYFRTPLKRTEGKRPYRRMGKWIPDTSPTATMLGQAQWKWLEAELKKPARLRLICSSIQFNALHNGYETWANIPAEKQRMVELIKSTRAEGIVFLSGDVHCSEMRIGEYPGCYPLTDYTSSSLNIPLGIAPTRRRTGAAFGGANFGIVEIDWNTTDPTVAFSTKDTRNQTRLHHRVSLSQLTFEPKNLSPQVKTDAFLGQWETFWGTMTISRKDKQWTATCPGRTATLTLENDTLKGTWKGQNRSGKLTFKLSRDGRFLHGAHSDGDLPLQLDWAAWKADWEKHFKRDDYHLRKK